MQSKNSYQQITTEDDKTITNRNEEQPNVVERNRCYWIIVVVIVAILSFAQGYYLCSSLNSSGYLREQIERYDLKNYDIVMHISDTHIDPYFDPTMSMVPGVCHPCNMSTKVYGDETWCPHPKTLHPSDDYVKLLNDHEAAFGRYGCNPPYRLWKSLHRQMLEIDRDPKVIIFTGDISPHGYPDDDYKVTNTTTVDDLCDTKYIVTKYMVEDLVRAFPNAKWAFTIGNNDHFPKNEFWQPYTDKFGKMLYETGFFTKQQYEQFLEYGSNYIDVDGIRYLSVDMSLFYADPHGEVNFDKDKPSVRTKVVDWTLSALQDARMNGLIVYFIGHQTLATKFGKDDLDFDLPQFKHLKQVLLQYTDIIRIGLFGHNNLAGIYEIMSDDFLPVFPGLVAPGVSPRGKNQPSFHVLYKDKDNGQVLDFEQWYFDLLQENHRAKSKPSTYLGNWKRHAGKLFSWRTMSNQQSYSIDAVHEFVSRIPRNPSDFANFEIWRRGGYVGDETPNSYECRSLYDREDLMMKCLFENQDPKCWNRAWLDDPVVQG